MYTNCDAYAVNHITNANYSLVTVTVTKLPGGKKEGGGGVSHIFRLFQQPKNTKEMLEITPQGFANTNFIMCMWNITNIF